MLKLLECRLNDNTAWTPIALAGSKRDIASCEVLNIIRAKYPALVEYALRVRHFANIPGVSFADDHTDRLVIID